MVDSGTYVGAGGTVVEAVLAASQSNEILQAIQIILAIISFVITILYTIWKWYENATNDKSDGGKKITKDEVDDLFKKIEDVTKENEDNDKH